MKSNIHNLSLQVFDNVEFFTPVIEAVINSILADSSEVRVMLGKNDEANDLLSSKISYVEIKDNGHGFNEDCQDSFENIAQSNKKHCKGLGRLSYIRIYDNIEVVSHFKDIENNLKELKFKFNKDFKKIDRKKEIELNSKNLQTGTTVIFQNIKSEFAEDVDNKCDAKFCFSKIIHYVLPHLCFHSCKLVVETADGDKEEFDLQNIEWSEWKKSEPIKINNQEFKIRYYQYETVSDKAEDNYFLYLAKDRAVSKVFPKGITNFKIGNNKKLIAVVSSNILDSGVSVNWKSFNKIKRDDWIKIGSRIKKEIGELVSGLIGDFVVNANLKEAKKDRPDLSKIIDEISSQEKWMAIEGKGAVIEEAEKRLSRSVSRLMSPTSSLIKINSAEVDTERVRESALMQLTVTRWADLSKAVQICNDPQVYEKEIHNLLYTQKTDSDSEKVNRLWLLDARWQYAEYISSDNEISKMFPTDADGNVLIEEIYNRHKLLFSEEDSKILKNDDLKKRPDIAIFNNDSVIIIELKKPGVELSYHIEKIKFYAALISFISKQKYRNIYGYLLGSTVPKLNDRAYKQNYGGMGYSYIAELGIFEEERNGKRTDLSETIFYGEICEYNKFLKDCYFQHLEFFKAIGKKIENLEKFLPEKFK